MQHIGAPGQTFHLPGPIEYTYNDLLELVSSLTYNPPSRAPTIPKPVALLITKVAQYAWWPLLSPDEVERRYLNDVNVKGDWDACGVSPEQIENVAIAYLRRYRSACVVSFTYGALIMDDNSPV